MLRWFTGKGEKGDKGDQGVQGIPGNDGYSPEASVMQTATGATVTIKDKNGITSATLTNGQDGAKGDDGVSPSATVTPTATGATIAITDKNGTTTANITNGTDGAKGDSGVSPTATVTPNANGAEIAITDANGTTTAQINNGSAGTNGVDGVSPTASVTPTASGATISITDKNGTTTANITNGSDGQKGADGVSPQASVQQTANGATITITDAGGTTSASITNGQNGQDGAKGDPGVGIPSGGSDGQVLVKDGVTDYATKWANPQGGGDTLIEVPINNQTFTSKVFNGALSPGDTKKISVSVIEVPNGVTPELSQLRDDIRRNLVKSIWLPVFVSYTQENNSRSHIMTQCTVGMFEFNMISGKVPCIVLPFTAEDGARIVWNEGSISSSYKIKYTKF